MGNKNAQLKLKIIWSKNVLGLAIDQINLNEHYSLTPYYFWPRTEAWDQLKLELDSKLWLTAQEKLKILQLSKDVMKYWFSYRDTKTTEDLVKDIANIDSLIFSN